MQNHNDDTIKISDIVFRKIYLPLYWKGCVWEGVEDWTEQQNIDPHSNGHNSVSFPFSWAAQPGALGPSLSGCWFSLPHLIFNWLNFLCTELYNCSTTTFFLWASQITHIQLVHGQRYIRIFLDQMHLLFTQVNFLFWQPGRVGGQYTTRFWYQILLLIRYRIFDGLNVVFIPLRTWIPDVIFVYLHWF